MTVERTIQSYDTIAHTYTERWQDRSMLREAMEMFTGLLPPRAVVLDAGCGPGFDAAALRQRGLRVVGLDRSWGMLQAGREFYPGPYVQGDMRFPPFYGGFDGIWANAALLHLRRDDLVPTLQEFRRLLPGGGVLYVSLKEGEGSQWTTTSYGSQSPRFFTFWRDGAFDDSLVEAGFRIELAWRDEKEDVTWLSRLARCAQSGTDHEAGE